MPPRTNEISSSTVPVSVTYSSASGFRYHSCKPDEYLFKSGVGIKNVQIAKKTCAHSELRNIVYGHCSLYRSVRTSLRAGLGSAAA